ncbi:MAG: GGDEF domain-containing protein [Patescibacteria group bacterium]
MTASQTLRYRLGFWLSIVIGVFVVGLLFWHLDEMRDLNGGGAMAWFIYLIVVLLLGSLALAAWAVRKIITNQLIYTRELEARTQKMRELATIDGLTKVYNHRYFEHKLEKEWERFERFSHALACVMIDIDNFKAINDTFGHRGGDMILRGVADLLRENLREIDIISRYGGEEFTVIFFEKPNTVSGLKKMMEKMRLGIANKKFELSGRQVQITASLGGALVPNPKIVSPQQLVHFADKAMYRAKKGGKNRSEVFETDDCC